MANEWSKAGNAYYEAASLYFKAGRKQLAASIFELVSRCYRKTLGFMTVETLVQAPDRSFPYRPIN
jgi:hypothetical protein